MKYARFVDHSNLGDGSDIRTIDIVDTSVYVPRPTWGTTDEELLNRMFAPNKAAWVDAGAWFTPIPDALSNGSQYLGGDKSDLYNYTDLSGNYYIPHSEVL